MIKKLLLCLLEINAKELIGRTGDKAPVSGIYRCGDEFIPLSKDETFPPASNQAVLWILVVNL